MIQTESHSPMIGIPVMMWLFGYFLANKGFNYEAKLAQARLVNLFNQPSAHPGSDDCPEQLEAN